MLDIVSYFEVMRNVFKAIMFNKIQLILVLMLGIVVIYNYSLFAFEFVDDTFFNVNTGPKGENMCIDMV